MSYSIHYLVSQALCVKTHSCHLANMKSTASNWHNRLQSVHPLDFNICIFPVMATQVVLISRLPHHHHQVAVQLIFLNLAPWKAMWGSTAGMAQATGDGLFPLSKMAEQPTFLLAVYKDFYSLNPSDYLVFWLLSAQEVPTNNSIVTLILILIFLQVLVTQILVFSVLPFISLACFSIGFALCFSLVFKGFLINLDIKPWL